MTFTLIFEIVQKSVLDLHFSVVLSFLTLQSEVCRVARIAGNQLMKARYCKLIEPLSLFMGKKRFP